MNSGIAPASASVALGKVTSAVPLTQKFSSSMRFLICSGFSKARPGALYASITVMRFWVNVPVLSEQITLMQPMVSHATIFLTSAFCLDILMMFTARHADTMVGRPSGTAATISVMEVVNASEIVSNEAVPEATNRAT